MNQVLNEFKTVQGVTGAYVFNVKGLVMANNLPALFKEAKLLNMGKMLSKIFSAGRLTFPDITEVFLSYEESIVVVREIVEKVYLIVLCEPSLNVNLVTLTMNLAMDDLRENIASAPAAPVRQPEAPPAVEKPSPVERTSGQKKGAAKEMLKAGPLVPFLQAMLTALAKVMGPMARIILEESLEVWQAVCQPSYDTLPKLVDILTLEIKDPEKVSSFREMVNSNIFEKDM